MNMLPRSDRLVHPQRPRVRSLERERVRLYIVLVLLDVLALLGAFGAAELVYNAYGANGGQNEGHLLLPLYLTLALYQRAYSIGALEDWRYATRRALQALVVSSAMLIFVTFYTKSTASFSRVIFTGGVIGCGVLLAASRYALCAALRRMWGPTATNRLVIYDGGPPVSLDHAIVVDARESGIMPDPRDPFSFDRLGRFLADMDRVVVSCTFESRERWAFALRASGVRGELVTDRLEELAPIGLVVEEGWRSLVVSIGPMALRQRAIKRGFDVALAGGALIVLAPVMAIIALAIRLDDGGPVFFAQPRMGRGNRLFSMLKFRSMRVDCIDSAGDRSAARDDDRVTRVGRFIRRTSLDELPQIINVLRNEMSIVGPRPHALGSQAGDKLFWDVDQAYWRRHSLKPGLTGLAQVRGLRGATDIEDDLSRRLAADLEYIANWTPTADALIVLRTLRVLVHPRAF